MSCFKKNRVVRSEYVRGSDGNNNMFFRKAGTAVVQQSVFARPSREYVEEADTIIIQWGGTPDFDSGYNSYRFPATMRGLWHAHGTMDKL